MQLGPRTKSQIHAQNVQEDYRVDRIRSQMFTLVAKEARTSAWSVVFAKTRWKHVCTTASAASKGCNDSESLSALKDFPVCDMINPATAGVAENGSAVGTAGEKILEDSRMAN